MRLAYSPDARWISFETIDRKVMAVPAAGGTPAELVAGRAHAWAPDGRRLYFVAPEVAGPAQIEVADVSQATESLAVSGVRIVGTNTRAVHQLVVGPDGRRLLATEIEEALNLARVPLSPSGDDVAGPEETLSSGEFRNHYPAVSASCSAAAAAPETTCGCWTSPRARRSASSCRARRSTT